MNKFRDFKIGDDIKFYALVESFQKRFTPNKSSYYSLSLTDGDQVIDSRVWDTNLIENNNISTNAVYLFEAHINEYAGKPQYVIKRISIPETGDYDINEFIRTAPISKDELKNLLKEYIKSIKNKTLREIVIDVINNVSNEYFTYPAAMSMHHNYSCGLAYHTYSMLRLAETYLAIYPGMNRDLLISGALIHDIGKTKELSQEQSPIYTLEGNLLGHIVIGLEMVSVSAAKYGSLESEEVKMLLHMIASHHGELEFGSPKQPGIMEAFALYLMDLTDSRLASMTDDVEKTKKGESTGPIGSIGRRPVYRPDLD